MKFIVIAFLFLSLNGWGQVRDSVSYRDSTVAFKYYNPQYYLLKAGNLGMGGVVTPLIGYGLARLVKYNKPEVLHPYNILWGSMGVSGVLLFCSFVNVRKAGMAVHERSKVRVTMTGNGLYLCYKF